MAKKTYIPGLTLFARSLLRYCRRWENKVQENLGETGQALFLALIAAADAMIEYLEAGNLDT